MEIRLAQTGDIPAILDLLRQVEEVHHRLRPDIFRPGVRKYDEEALRAILADASRPVFVAAEGETVPGYCFCVWKEYRGNPLFTDRVELYIDDLCVDAGHRGQGVAAALYRHVCAWAKQRGCDFLTLNVWCGNEGARRFYEKMGLRPRSVTMEMPLGEPKC